MGLMNCYSCKGSGEVDCLSCGHSGRDPEGDPCAICNGKGTGQIDEPDPDDE